MRPRVRRSLAIALMIALAPLALAQQGDGTNVRIDTNVWKPAKVPADAAHIAQLRVPRDFVVNVFARDYGPRPPVGDPPHHYHFQVFALDTMLDVPPGAERDRLLAAMSGHVLAAGEVVGTYQQTQVPLK